MVDVSIILITWAETKGRMTLLKKTLNSLRASTNIPYELIVVDNGPKEQTTFLKTQKIDKHIINKVNQGIGKARNQGMEVAEGEYIVFVDNDILFLKSGWLEDSIKIIEENPTEKIIVAAWLSLDSIKRRKYRRLCVGKLNECSIFQRAGPACWVAKKEIINDIGEWSLSSTPGRFCCMKLTKLGYKYVGLKEHKIEHIGRKKSYSYRKKLINGVWVDHGGDYWDNLWEMNAVGNKYFKGHGRLFREIKQYLNGKIVDLACGVTPLYIGSDYDVTGLDCSPEAIKQSRKWYPKGNFIVRNIEKTRLQSNCYDTVLLISIIEHFNDFSIVLLEAKRICKVGGKIVIVVPIKNIFEDHIHPTWNEEKIEKEIVPIIGKVSYYKRSKKWWVIIYEKT